MSNNWMWFDKKVDLGSRVKGMRIKTDSEIWSKSDKGSGVRFVQKLRPNQRIEVHI